MRSRCKGVSLHGGGLAVLCVALFASVVSLAGGGLGASPVLAQGASGPWARVWAKKLASGNVEFGVAVYATSDANASPATVNNRYFRYADSTVGTWYNSEALLLRSGTDSALVAVRARKLASGNVEFALRVYGVDDSYWMPRARYFAYSTANVGDTEYSSAFSLRQHAQECLGGAVGTVTTSNLAAKFGLFRDCEALLASRDALEGTTNRLSNWTGSVSINSWTGVRVNSNRVTELTLQSGNGANVFPPLNLDGTIPKYLGKLSALQNLFLDANRLTGEIPPELENLGSLEYLGLDHNSLTGSIPAELGNLSNLVQLYLDNNSLTGGIPAELGNLSNLQYLHLRNNKLTGGIPASLGSLTSLAELYLSMNLLSGNIPAELGKLASANGGDIQAIHFHNIITTNRNNPRYRVPGADDNPGLSGCVPSALSSSIITVWRDLDNLPFCS